MDNREPPKGCVWVGEGVVIKGDVSLPGTITVDGTVEGTVTARELLVGTSGHVAGSVSVATADIRGSIGRSIRAEEHITLRATGRVEGNLVYRSLEIERGGVVEGEILLINSSAESSSSSTPRPTQA